MSRRALVAACIAGVALLAAGCGGSSDSSSDTTAATEWADGVCSSITTWKSSITSIADSLKNGGLTEDSLTTAVDDAKDATETLAADLEDLGTPDTDSGQEAKDAVDKLATDLREGATTIEDAVSGASGVSGILSAVSTVSSTLTSMGTAVTSAVSNLEDLDAKGELQTAFGEASSCDGLTS
jgi:methyl-accepting chemotaxis protein